MKKKSSINASSSSSKSRQFFSLDNGVLSYIDSTSKTPPFSIDNRGLNLNGIELVVKNDLLELSPKNIFVVENEVKKSSDDDDVEKEEHKSLKKTLVFKKINNKNGDDDSDDEIENEKNGKNINNIEKISDMKNSSDVASPVLTLQIKNEKERLDWIEAFHEHINFSTSILNQ
jgi:hypothetical protein